MKENIDKNYSTIRELIEWITYECHSTYNVRELNIKLKSKKFYNDIKGISFMDVAGMVLEASDLLF